MYQQTYYVPKGTGTLSDALLAYGVAKILQLIYQNQPGGRRHGSVRVSIQDQDGCYVIRLPGDIREEWFADAEWLKQPVIPDDVIKAVRREAKPRDETKTKQATKPKPEKKVLPEEVPQIDYNAIWDGIRKITTLIEAQRQQGRTNWKEIEELRNSLRDDEPHRDVALLIGEYRMQVEKIHNQAVVQWFMTQKAGYLGTNLKTILHMFASAQSDIDAIAKAWAKEVKLDGVKTRLTASQVFNPSMGKGQNRAKADQLVMGNKDYFWLLEYLKAVGLFAATAPRAFSAENMYKSYVIAPANIELDKHEKIFGDFKRTLDGAGISPAKADVLTSLDYAHTYLSRCREARVDDPEFDIDPNPRNTVKGFYVATYILLSQNAFTMMNLAFLGLPPWLNQIYNRDDVDAVQEVIEEHKQILRPLKEKFQAEYSLIDTYRDFLTGHRTDAFFAFCVGYGEFVVHMLPDNHYIRQQTIESLDQIFRRIDMPDVDPNDFISTSKRHEGFHRIADAIRLSTVIPQRQLARHKEKPEVEKKPLYDVRYGLGNNLRRKADSVDGFMSALMEFVQLYNAETAQVYENTSKNRREDPEFGKNRYRKQVAVVDLDDVLMLIQQYDVALVCNMLLAYGYAAKYKTREAQLPDNDQTEAHQEEE